MKYGKILAIVAIAGSLYATTTNNLNKQIVEAYAQGHSQGINQIKREFELQGYKKQKVSFKKYLSVMDISNIPQNKILLIKNYAFFDGLLPLTVHNDKLGDLIVFASFDRKIDATSTTESLNQKIPLEKGEQIKVIKNNEYVFFKKPFIYKWIFDKMLKDIKDSVKTKVYVIRENLPQTKNSKNYIEENQTKTNYKKLKKPTISISHYRVKFNNVDTYYYGDKFVGYGSKKWNDLFFKKRKYTFKKGKIFKSANSVTTKYGDNFVKVLNQNIFVEKNNVEKVK